MSDSTCPTCGARVTVVTGGEGTSHYQPQGDRVSNIERDEPIPDTVQDFADWADGPEVKALDLETFRRVVGELNAAREQLRGAVKALEEIAGYTGKLPGALAMRGHARDALVELGVHPFEHWGQSPAAGCPACSRVPGVARPPHTCSGDQS
jgi:L-fucose isomerase-like protein